MFETKKREWLKLSSEWQSEPNETTVKKCLFEKTSTKTRNIV